MGLCSRLSNTPFEAEKQDSFLVIKMSDEGMKDDVSLGKGGTNHRMTPLSDDFEPGKDDVICGRGKKCYNHIGNERFRRRVVLMLDEYAKAKSKLDKSGVLSAVVDQVRLASPRGGFVKQDESGRWFEVGDFLAREKTSQAFRDALHEQYKSSNVSKKKRRQEEQARTSDKFSKIARSEFEISARLERLTRDVISRGRSGTVALDIFDQTNYDIMRGLRRIQDGSRSSFQRSISSSAFRPPHSGGHSCPDPLFGGGRNSMNTSPFPDPELVSSVPDGQEYRQRCKSDYGDHCYSEYVELMHHSMPELRPLDDSIGADLEVLHHSMPNLSTMVSKAHSAIASEDESNSNDLEPIPLHSIDSASSRRDADKVSKKISVEEDDASQHRDGLSKDLLECLSKLTEHTISDPFEPIPLRSPTRKPSAAIGRFTPVDDTSLEFAEG